MAQLITFSLLVTFSAILITTYADGDVTSSLTTVSQSKSGQKVMPSASGVLNEEKSQSDLQIESTIHHPTHGHGHGYGHGGHHSGHSHWGKHGG